VDELDEAVVVWLVDVTGDPHGDRASPTRLRCVDITNGRLDETAGGFHAGAGAA
jgi:hypothetical protein